MNRRFLLMAAGLGGCSILPQRPYVERRDWPLDVQRPTVLPPNPRAPVLLIRTLRAAPGLEAQGLQTIQTDGSVQTGYYERWSVPPADAVDEQLRRWLAASGLFAGVLPPGSRAHADLALEGELLSLVAAPAQGESRAAMGIVLVDLRPAQPHLLLQAEETAAAPLAGTEPPEIAQSGRQAVAALLNQVEHRIAPLLSGRANA